MELSRIFASLASCSTLWLCSLGLLAFCIVSFAACVGGIPTCLALLERLLQFSLEDYATADSRWQDGVK